MLEASTVGRDWGWLEVRFRAFKGHCVDLPAVTCHAGGEWQLWPQPVPLDGLTLQQSCQVLTRMLPETLEKQCRLSLVVALLMSHTGSRVEALGLKWRTKRYEALQAVLIYD